MSNNDNEDQNIINGELPKVSRHKYNKQGTNYSKNKKIVKELDLTDLKLKINTLALQLSKEKAINKPLAKKIFQMVLKRTRRPRLEETYNSLQQIDHNLKTGKKGNEKITIKELKVIGEDAKMSYNVYRKFIVIINDSEKDKTRLAYNEEMEVLSRQLADGFIDENEYMKYADKPKYKYEYRNITSVVKGLYNIKNVIKDDIDYFLSMPYVLKVDVVQVIANKIDLNSKTYRYRGAIDKKDDIVYDKAWNANKNLFQYKAYNMDPNNDVPLECVPNALFKMYGDKTKAVSYTHLTLPTKRIV